SLIKSIRQCWTSAPSKCGLKMKPRRLPPIGSSSLWSNSSRVLEITGFENVHVMKFVACNVVSQRTRRDFTLVCGATPLPFFAGEVLEELHAGLPHRRELLDQAGECPRIEIRTRDIIVLLKAGQRRLVVAADTQCTVGK